MPATQEDVDKQGALVRQLKGEKADKAVITAEVKKLIALKNEVAAGTGGAPVAVKQTKAQKKATQQSSKQSTTASQEDVHKQPPKQSTTAPQTDVDKQAALVRKLKGEKADKEVIKAEVDKLLALKNKASAGTGDAPAVVKQTNSERKAAKRAVKSIEKEKKKAQPKKQNKHPAAPSIVLRTTTSDCAWAPLVPVGHTGFSWEEDNSSDEEEAAAPALKPQSNKPLSGVGCKSPTQPQAEPDAASTAKMLGSGPEPDFGAMWRQQNQKFKVNCKLVSLMDNNLLVWNAAAAADKQIMDCPEADAFAQTVTDAINTKAVSISQGVHDRYVTYCNSKKQVIGVVASGKSLYTSAVPLLHGIGVSVDKQKAIEMLRNATTEGCGEAISLLGYCYQLGDGVGVNAKLAAELYLSAARKGDAHGMVRLGRLYANGVEGVLEKDDVKAKALIEYGMTVLNKLYNNPTTTRVEKSRALSLLHSNMTLV